MGQPTNIVFIPMFVSLTRLRVRRFVYLPQFLWWTQFAKLRHSGLPALQAEDF
jgi:hypothetical protein